jgi:hypothetical protein
VLDILLDLQYPKWVIQQAIERGLSGFRPDGIDGRLAILDTFGEEMANAGLLT